MFCAGRERNGGTAWTESSGDRLRSGIHRLQECIFSHPPGGCEHAVYCRLGVWRGGDCEGTEQLPEKIGIDFKNWRNVLGLTGTFPFIVRCKSCVLKAVISLPVKVWLR